MKTRELIDKLLELDSLKEKDVLLDDSDLIDFLSVECVELTTDGNIVISAFDLIK
jgi:hypothetical protein